MYGRHQLGDLLLGLSVLGGGRLGHQGGLILLPPQSLMYHIATGRGVSVLTLPPLLLQAALRENMIFPLLLGYAITRQGDQVGSSSPPEIIHSLVFILRRTGPRKNVLRPWWSMTGSAGGPPPLRERFFTALRCGELSSQSTSPVLVGAVSFATAESAGRPPSPSPLFDADEDPGLRGRPSPIRERFFKPRRCVEGSSPLR